MKKASDFLQVILSDGGLIGFAAWCVVILLLLQAVKLASVFLKALFWIWRQKHVLLFIPNSMAKATVVLSLAGALFLWRDGIVDQIQYVEQMYLRPTYIVADSSFWATSCYETELKKHTTASEFETVRDSTYSLANELGCQPLAIYEVAFSECGMNPFCVRKDGIAAGWIQFTTIGVKGIGVTLDEVKSWCRARDTKKMMALTGRYMRSAAAGRKLPTSTDVYCAVFAPGKISHESNQALYRGWGNPEYFLNKGLDGYVVRGSKVLALPSSRDGVLTKNDLTGALAYKKSVLLKKYQ